MADGLYWFQDLNPEIIAQKFSVSATRLGPHVAKAVSETVDGATEIMRNRILTGGVMNRAYTGGPRIDTGAMFNSVDGHVKLTASARVSGEYGYLNDPPYWTIFQEDGTRTGILPLHALQMATEYARRKLAEEVSTVDIWSSFR